jgi:hypothetical protein
MGERRAGRSSAGRWIYAARRRGGRQASRRHVWGSQRSRHSSRSTRVVDDLLGMWPRIIVTTHEEAESLGCSHKPADQAHIYLVGEHSGQSASTIGLKTHIPAVARFWQFSAQITWAKFQSLDSRYQSSIRYTLDLHLAFDSLRSVLEKRLIFPGVLLATPPLFFKGI